MLRLLTLAHGDEGSALAAYLDGGLLPFLAGLALAVGYGAAHALSPGHGKTLVAAYLIQSRGRLRDAFLLGGVVTLTHTGTIIILGLIFALWLKQSGADERVQVNLKVWSGAAVALLGAWLLAARVWRLAAARAGSNGAGEGGHHAHEHHHEHDNSSHDHDHGGGEGHEHEHEHEHEGGHALGHGLLPHVHPGVSDAEIAGFISGKRRGAGGLPVWQTISLGFLGGIVPCPGALTVLALGIQSGRPWVALVYVLAFSAGLAATLTTVGALMVLGSRRLLRTRARGRLTVAAPLFSAAVIAVLGLAMVVAAAVEHGVITFDGERLRALLG
ncbi:MAG: hypothetical protein HY719_13915 [Planctomycetes bacterium]|nr:hypothetical protein [Planctomycetota bacterium]